MNVTLIPLAKVMLMPLLACTGSATPSIVEPAPISQEPVASTFEHAHTAWTEVLTAHVQGDLFDYSALSQDRAHFDGYLASLHAVTPAELAGWNREQRYAFWINAYNAHTIQMVVDEYPLESIRDLDRGFGLKSVFDKEFIAMKAHHPDGKSDQLSLNDIEHKILRERFKDARVHAAVNCASAGCPPLLGEAFVASELEDQLDAQMKAFVRDPKRNRFDRDKGTVGLSEVFKWFAEDFERDAGSVKEYLLRYAPTEDAALIRSAKFEYLDYSWALNEPTKS